MKIPKVHGREILDSRGNPDGRSRSHARRRGVRPGGGAVGRVDRGARGAGAARRRQERAISARASRKAVGNVNGEIATAVTGSERSISAALDEAMIALDGTPTKGRLGANAMLGVSMAPSRAGSGRGRRAALRAPRAGSHGGTGRRHLLPVPMMNILNGGAHADTSVDFQEFMVMPVGAPSFAEALRAGARSSTRCAAS